VSSATYELLDPAQITVRNIRQATPSERLVDSIREHGVLQPVGVLRTPDGELVLRFGDRRRQACALLGYPVPAIVVNGTAGTPEAEIDRIFQQWDENDGREDLTAADRAAAVQALFDLGADEAVITRKTGLGKAAIAAARKVAASETARTLAAQYPLDLEQAAHVAELGTDAATTDSLVKAAGEGRVRFEHAVEQARAERADRLVLDAHAAKLEKGGIKVTRESLPWENRIYFWAGKDGSEMSAREHKACPGNVVTLSIGSNGKAEESWWCTDPKGNGHKRHRPRGSGAGQTEEEAAAERKLVIDGNKAWRSAEKVRRAWLREFLARPKVPDGALQYTLEALARADHALRYAMDSRAGGRHVMARQMLGLAEGEGSSYSRPPEVYEAMVKASPARAQVIALAIVLGAHEDQTSVQSWRTPGTDTAGYLETIAGWGYQLAEIEQELVASVRKKEAERAAAVKADEAAAAGHRSAGEAAKAARQEEQ
jgi:ParB family chromosome partitioning protein